MNPQQTALLQTLLGKYKDEAKFLALENSRLQQERQDALKSRNENLFNIVKADISINQTKSDAITAFIVELEEILNA